MIREWGIRLLLGAGGIAAAMVVVTIAAPLLITLDNGRVANLDLGMVEFTVGMGDLWLVQPGTIRPPENPYEVLSRHQLGWDEQGFRISQRPSDRYQIVALGDSYTESANVAMPWPDVLAAETGLAVRNLGFRGYGPQEEALVMREYGVQYDPEIVVLGFFGGNDISNVASFEERSEQFILPELIELSVESFNDDTRPWESEHDTYLYPVTLQFTGGTFEIAFFHSYISWLNVTEADLRNSRNLDLTVEIWNEMRDMTPDACFIIAFFPSKPQIYLPYVIPEHRQQIIHDLAERKIDDPGETLSRATDSDISWNTLMSRRDNLGNIVGEAAQVQGFHFINLTPYFEQTASSGEILYYTYDTHWNQSGHNLAGRVIAEQIKAGMCDSD